MKAIGGMCSGMSERTNDLSEGSSEQAFYEKNLDPKMKYPELSYVKRK